MDNLVVNVNDGKKQDDYVIVTFVNDFLSRTVFLVTVKNFHSVITYYDDHNKVNFIDNLIINVHEKVNNYDKSTKINVVNPRVTNQMNIHTVIIPRLIVTTQLLYFCNYTNVNKLTIVVNNA